MNRVWKIIGKKLNTRLQQLRRRANSGNTLIEMVVTFALLGLFMVAASQVIVSTMNVYYQVRSESSGIQISAMLMDKIRGELENALVSSQESSFLIGADGKNLHGAVMIAEDGSLIDFTNVNGSHVTLGANTLKTIVNRGENTNPEADGNGSADAGTPVNPFDDGKKYLNEYYYAVESVEIDDNDNEEVIELYKAVDWQFALDAYMGYSIKKLTFTQLSSDSNVIRIDLTIESDRYGEYSTTEYVALYNFKNIYSAAGNDKTSQIVSGTLKTVP